MQLLHIGSPGCELMENSYKGRGEGPAHDKHRTTYAYHKLWTRAQVNAMAKH